MEMLKEVFVIGNGIPFFYYSSDKKMKDSDSSIILSSGLLSAIKDFSETTRSDVIDSFSTEREYFLFMKCCDEDKVVVSIFDRKVPERLARDALKKIHDLVEQTLVSKEEFPVLNTPEKEKLKKEISVLVSQLFSVEGQASYIKEMLQKRTNIPLAFLVDSEERKEITHFARPKPLFREEQIKEFLLLFTTLQQALSKLGLSDSYSYFTIRSQEYAVASVWSGKILSLATGAPQTPEQEVLDAAINMCYYASLDSLVSLSHKNTFTLNRSTLPKNGSIIHEEGEPLPQLSGIILSTLINNINGFSKLINHRAFDELNVFIIDGGTKRLSLHRKNSSEDFAVSLFRYS